MLVDQESHVSFVTIVVLLYSLGHHDIWQRLCERFGYLQRLCPFQRPQRGQPNHHKNGCPRELVHQNTLANRHHGISGSQFPIERGVPVVRGGSDKSKTQEKKIPTPPSVPAIPKGLMVTVFCFVSIDNTLTYQITATRNQASRNAFGQ